MKLRKVNISDVTDVNPRPPAELAKEVSRLVDFVPMSQLSEQGFVKSNGSKPLGEVVKGYTYFANGDVLVAKITPCMENGKAAYVHSLPHKVGFGSTEFHVLRPGPDIDARYLFYMVWNPVFRNTAEGNMTGSAGQKRVPAKFFDRFPIPLPPLSEQKRIADILGKADAIRRKRQEAQQHLASLIDARFLDAFGDPLANPKQWSNGTFNDHLTLVQYGPRFYNEAYSADGVRIVRITDLDFQGGLDYSAMPLMTASAQEMNKFCLQPGDLLLARSGATVGKTALIDDEAPECIAGAYFIRLKFTDQVLPLFAQMVLRSRPVQTIIAAKSRQSAQQNFNGPAIRSLPLPVPPLKLQHEFNAFHTRTLQAGKQLAQATNQVGDLFNSLVQRAFKGEL